MFDSDAASKSVIVHETALLSVNYLIVNRIRLLSESIHTIIFS